MGFRVWMATGRHNGNCRWCSRLLEHCCYLSLILLPVEPFYNYILYASHHNLLLIINHSWILTIHKARILRKKWVWNIQAARYNGACIQYINVYSSVGFHIYVVQAYKDTTNLYSHCYRKISPGRKIRLYSLQQHCNLWLIFWYGINVLFTSRA